MRGNNGARAECFQLCFTSATHVWINLHRHRLDDFCLTPDQFGSRFEAQRSLSKLKTTALRWFDCVNQSRRALRIDVNLALTQTVQTHLRRVFVFDNQGNRTIRGVVDVNPDVRIGAHRETAAKLSRYLKSFRQVTQPRVGERRAQEQNVVSECDPGQPWSLPRE